MGAKQTKSTICSMVCLWTGSCGRGGSARLKRSGWGEGGLQELGRVLRLALLLPGPGLPLSPWGGMVRHLGQGQIVGWADLSTEPLQIVLLLLLLLFV